MNDLLLVIIDDEPKVAEALKGMITKILFPNQRIKVFVASSVKFGAELIKNYQPDIVFLDIRMPDENGFELFNQVDLKNIEVVFTTAYSEYAIESINKYGCLGYLLKPIGREELQVIFDRYKENREKSNFLRFINDNGKRVLVNYDNILLFQAASNYCDIFLKNKKFIVSKTLKVIETENTVKNIIRVHRSYMVNLDHISHYNREDECLYFKKELKKHQHDFIEKVPVGESYKNSIKNFYI